MAKQPKKNTPQKTKAIFDVLVKTLASPKPKKKSKGK